MRILFKLAVLSALPVLITSPLFGKRKDDVVVMQNGDKFTGEIKGLENGELVFKSDYMTDSVHLDWRKVEVLQSQDTFIVALSNGERITGLMEREKNQGESDKNFKIMAGGSPVKVEPSEVIAIGQREGNFWNQLTGSVSYGFGFASGNNSTNSSLAADVAYRTARNSVTLATSSQFDSQTNAENTNRFTFDAQYGRMLSEKWIAGGLYGLLNSNQQDLKLRSTYGGVLGRKVLQTDRTSITVLGGAVYTHESYVPQPGTESVRDNAEALVGVTFSTFRFKTLDVTSQTFLFPSLSDLGRVRLSSQSNVRIELIRNFYWNFQLYENYDSRPPVTAPKNDLGITTSLGWTF